MLPVGDLMVGTLRRAYGHTVGLPGHSGALSGCVNQYSRTEGKAGVGSPPRSFHMRPLKTELSYAHPPIDS